MESNPFFKLEHDRKDVAKAKEQAPRLVQIQKLNERDWSDPYTASQRLRKRFRVHYFLVSMMDCGLLGRKEGTYRKSQLARSNKRSWLFGDSIITRIYTRSFRS